MDMAKKHKALALGGHLYRLFVKGEDTGGAYTIFEANVPPMDIGPPPHIHRNEDMAFYIVEGLFRFSLEENEFNAVPGDFVFLPRGLKHWLSNESGTMGKMLVIASPSGFDRFIHAAGVPLEDDTKMPPPPTNEELMKLVQEAPKFGIDVFL